MSVENRELNAKNLRLLLYQLTNTSYSIDLNTPYVSVEYQYVVLNSQNTPYCLEEHDTLFRLYKSIRCPERRFDTSYPTCGYAVSVIQLDTAYGRKGIRHIGNWSNAFSCEELAPIRRIFLVRYGVCS
ncbi:hypothetical protein Tco_1385264 [Tanacetum coccineum]